PALDQFFVVKGQAKNLASANLVDFTPSNTTQKTLNYELITQNPNVSLENGMLLVGKDFAGASVDIRATSPHLAGNEVILSVDVLPMLDEETVALQSITYSGAELEPIFQAGQGEVPTKLELSANLAARQTVEFVFEVRSNKSVTITPFVLSTNGQSSRYINFATGKKTEITDGSGNLLATQYVFELSAEGSLGQDAICFKAKFNDFDYDFTTQKIDVVVKDTVNKIQLFVDGVLSNQSQFTVYDSYQNKLGLALSFNVLPTTVSVAEKTLILELGANAGAYKFFDEEGQELVFTDGKVEFDGSSKIFVRASAFNALAGQVKIYAKENPVVKQVLTFNAAAGTTFMEFINASETITAPNGAIMYYYNLKSNEALEQIVQFKADTADLRGLTVELSGNVVEITSAPIAQTDFFQFTIQSIAGKEGTATITLRQANGYFVQAYVRVIYELVEDEVQFFVPSAQTNAAVGFMERQNDAAWQFRVAITKSASVTLTREGLGVTGVEYGFYDIVKTEDNQAEYENFFGQYQADPSALTFSATSAVLDTKFLALDQLKPATVGKTWVQVVVKGLKLEEAVNAGKTTLQLADVEYKYYFLVEGYIPAQNFALSTYALNLYSQSSVGYQDLDKTTADVVLSLNDATYQNITWLGASPLYQVNGHDVYKTQVSADNKTLSITALSTWTYGANGAPVLADAVEFAFTALIKEFNTEYRLSVVVKITRAVQVEKIVVENVNLDTGIYIPLTYDGKAITRQILASVQVGESGKLPFNTNLVYEFLPYTTAPANAISLNKTTGLLTISANAEEGTYGQIRIAPADRYNAQNQYIAGANDVAIYFNLVVADGQSRETSFRVAALSDFEKYTQNANQLKHLHFTLVDDITITNANALDENFAICADFAGGLYGALTDGGEKSVITTSLPLFGTLDEKAVVADLMLCGEVVGAGFVATENNGLINNVLVDAKQQIGAFAAPSILTAQAQGLGIG
ncbi:MAG: hypothetical protein IKB21_01720, partial [Clostridia bacterium]|nr:hypothetical protein [Clostridia bacterium]